MDGAKRNKGQEMQQIQSVLWCQSGRKSTHASRIAASAIGCMTRSKFCPHRRPQTTSRSDFGSATICKPQAKSAPCHVARPTARDFRLRGAPGDVEVCRISLLFVDLATSGREIPKTLAANTRLVIRCEAEHHLIAKGRGLLGRRNDDTLTTKHPPRMSMSHYLTAGRDLAHADCVHATSWLLPQYQGLHRCDLPLVQACTCL